LISPEFSKELRLAIDASDVCVGLKEKYKIDLPMFYFSKKKKKKNRKKKKKK
jgi:hypothetical protein